MLSPFPCSPVVQEWLWKKTQIEKKSVPNWAQLSYFPKDGNFLANSNVTFVLMLVVPHQATTFPKNRVDHDIKVCIILGLSSVFLGKTVCYFCLPTAWHHAINNFTKIVRVDHERKGCMNWGKLRPKFPICPKRRYLEKIDYVPFSPVLSINMLQHFKKNP